MILLGGGQVDATMVTKDTSVFDIVFFSFQYCVLSWGNERLKWTPMKKNIGNRVLGKVISNQRIESNYFFDNHLLLKFQHQTYQGVKNKMLTQKDYWILNFFVLSNLNNCKELWQRVEAKMRKRTSHTTITAQKMKFSTIKDFFSKEILKKSLMESFIFCVVYSEYFVWQELKNEL